MYIDVVPYLVNKQHTRNKLSYSLINIFINHLKNNLYIKKIHYIAHLKGSLYTSKGKKSANRGT